MSTVCVARELGGLYRFSNVEIRPGFRPIREVGIGPRDLEARVGQQFGMVAAHVATIEEPLLHGVDPELPGLQPLVGRQPMLAEMQRTAGFDDPPQFGQRSHRVSNSAKGKGQHAGVTTVVVKRDALPVEPNKLDVDRRSGQTFGGELLTEHRRVNCVHLRDFWRVVREISARTESRLDHHTADPLKTPGAPPPHRLGTTGLVDESWKQLISVEAHGCQSYVSCRRSGRSTHGTLTAMVRCSVYIAASLDGYIAGPNGSLEWLESIPPLDDEDYGYSDFTADVDTLVMGRNTYEAVAAMDVDWPYEMPVMVLTSRTLDVPADLKERVFPVAGDPHTLIASLGEAGARHVWIDGGAAITSFLNASLIDRLIITTVPILLGGGAPLFGPLANERKLQLISSASFDNGLTQATYVPVSSE